MHHARYHVRLGSRRTTVSLDTLLSRYLALHLGCKPETPQAHEAVRQWLQQRLDADHDPHRQAVSQWLQRQVVDTIVDKPLSAAYGDWLDAHWEPRPLCLTHRDRSG